MHMLEAPRHMLPAPARSRFFRRPTPPEAVGILLAALVLLNVISCAPHTIANRSLDRVAGTVRLVSDLGIDPAPLREQLESSLGDLSGPSGSSFEVCVYGFSRGRELFRYSGDESARVESTAENMTVAVLIRVTKSENTARVLFAEASGENEARLYENITKKILHRLDMAGIGPAPAR